MPASECASRRWWFLRDEFIVGGGYRMEASSPSHAQVTRTGRPIPTCCGCRRGTNKPPWNPMRLQSRLRQPDCEPAMSLLTRRRSPATSVAEGSDRFSVQREETVIHQHASQSDSVSPTVKPAMSPLARRRPGGAVSPVARRRPGGAGQAEARRPPLPRRSNGLFKRSTVIILQA